MPKVQSVGEVYKCEVCGNVVEVKEVGGGELVCCQKPMTKISGQLKQVYNNILHKTIKVILMGHIYTINNSIKT